MRQEFPHEHELLWLFEAEPILDDPNEYWQFTTLNFKLTRHSQTLWCSMTPYLGDMTVVLEHEGQVLVRLDLFDIVSTKVMQKDHQEYLEVKFESSVNLRPLKVQVKPTLMVTWGLTAPGGLNGR